MTWNVRAIAETVRGQRPDFVALQETWSSDAEAQTGRPPSDHYAVVADVPVG